MVLPPIAQHSEAEDGILHDPRVMACPLPAGLPPWTSSGCQMVAPLPCHPMEADRHESFNVVVPGAARVALSTPGGEVRARAHAHSLGPVPMNARVMV